MSTTMSSQEDELTQPEPHGSHLFNDGRWEHVFHQSWVNTYMKCPEQARLKIRHELPRIESDAAARGTSLHLGIERLLGGDSWAMALEAATDEFDARCHLPEFQWVQVKKQATVEKHIEGMLKAWATHVYPQIGEAVEIETKFREPLVENGTRAIYVGGAWDLVDELETIWDWKSASRPYEPWEAKRFFLQPTMYAFGLAESSRTVRPDVEFTYAVMVPGKDVPQLITVVRNDNHFEWLAQQLQVMARRIEGGLHEPWDLNDQGWHCSPKWCPVWGSCKGSLIEQV